MHRPSAQEFLQGLLDTLDDLPKEFASRFEEILKKEEEHANDLSTLLATLNPEGK